MAFSLEQGRLKAAVQLELIRYVQQRRARAALHLLPPLPTELVSDIVAAFPLDATAQPVRVERALPAAARLAYLLH